MARKTIEINIKDREQTLTFRLKEMPATQLESWIIRALLLLSAAGVQVPEGTDLQQAGGFLAERGLAAFGSLEYDKARPLLDELLGCCYRVMGNVEERCAPETVDNYIMDVATLFRLRMEAINLNLGFSRAEPASPSACPEKEPTTAP